MARTTLEAQLAKLRKAKEDIIKKEKALLDRTQGKVIERIAKLAIESGVSLAQIGAALKSGKPGKSKSSRGGRKSSGAKVAPKYRNPANPAETWTGRGKAPVWARSLKEAGVLDSALIQAGE